MFESVRIQEHASTVLCGSSMDYSGAVVAREGVTAADCFGCGFRVVVEGVVVLLDEIHAVYNVFDVVVVV